MPEKKIFTATNVFMAVLLSIIYLLLSHLLVGFKGDQLSLVLIFNIMFFLSEATRKFITGFSIFIVYWIIFDYMKAFPNYLFNKVHIEDLYHAEQYLFGISTPNAVITPNEFWALHHTTFLDVLTGIFYLTWVPVPLLFAAYLFFKNKKQFISFALTFVWINLLGFVIYYLMPAAPPWYVQLHGYEFIPNTPGNTAGLIRFDKFLNINLFQAIYSKGSNVFAAMPSLHSAYPVLVVFYGIKNKMGSINIFFITVMLGIWFAAVYSSHHYVLDVLAGITCAILGISSIAVLFKLPSMSRLLNHLTKRIV